MFLRLGVIWAESSVPMIVSCPGARDIRSIHSLLHDLSFPQIYPTLPAFSRYELVDTGRGLRRSSGWLHLWL